MKTTTSTTTAATADLSPKPTVTTNAGNNALATTQAPPAVVTEVANAQRVRDGLKWSEDGLRAEVSEEARKWNITTEDFRGYIREEVTVLIGHMKSGNSVLHKTAVALSAWAMVGKITDDHWTSIIAAGRETMRNAGFADSSIDKLKRTARDVLPLMANKGDCGDARAKALAKADCAAYTLDGEDAIYTALKKAPTEAAREAFAAKAYGIPSGDKAPTGGRLKALRALIKAEQEPGGLLTTTPKAEAGTVATEPTTTTEPTKAEAPTVIAGAFAVRVELPIERLYAEYKAGAKHIGLTLAFVVATRSFIVLDNDTKPVSIRPATGDCFTDALKAVDEAVSVPIAAFGLRETPIEKIAREASVAELAKGAPQGQGATEPEPADLARPNQTAEPLTQEAREKLEGAGRNRNRNRNRR